MSQKPRILAFAGSARTDSFNKKVIRIAAQGARAAGAEVTLTVRYAFHQREAW
jgi:chromate reductase